jgi:hypothetical protein
MTGAVTAPAPTGGIVATPDDVSGVKITLPDAGFGNTTPPEASTAPKVTLPNAVRVTVGLVILRGAVSKSYCWSGYSTRSRISFIRFWRVLVTISR